jgi:DNA-binding MarR family transcriptional regulator
MSESGRTPWTLLSNHGHVLMCIAAAPDTRLRDIAARVGITERSVFAIVDDLEKAGMVRRVKVGRRNTYEIVRSARLRHPIEAEHSVGELIDLLADPSD